jgi:tetratricopeptide (TPR) repeat protein
MGLGVIYRHKGLLDQAIEMLQQSLEISRNMGNMHDIALALGNLGSVIRQKGEWNQAIELYEESLTITERMGDWVNSANQYGNLGNLYLQTNRPDEAKPLLARAYLIFSQLGSPHQRTSANALIQSFDGDVAAANAYLAEAQRKLQEEMTSDDE